MVSSTYNEDTDTFSPAINKSIKGKLIVPEIANGYTVSLIGDHSFVECQFSEIELPNTIADISRSAFERCTLLQEIFLPSHIQELGNYAFRSCTNLTKASIATRNLGYHGFAGCTNLKSIEFRSSVRDVDSYAFRDCKALSSLSFPAGLETIWCNAFSYCYLDSLFLPSSLIKIQNGAFDDCRSLSDVIIACETPPHFWPEMEYPNLFKTLPSSAVLYVPDKTKYNCAPWTHFSTIKSFLPTVEKAVYYTHIDSKLKYAISFSETIDQSDILELVIDGRPRVPEVEDGYLTVSNYVTLIPQEVSFLWRKKNGDVVPYKLHYNVRDLGFSINGKQMTTLNMYDVPGLVSGEVYITENPTDPDYPMLVLDNAVLEWDTDSYGLYNESLSQDGLTIKVIGDCTIRVPNAYAAFELDVATVTHITGGGTLHILSKGNGFESWVVARLVIQDNTTVIAESTNGYGYYEQNVATLEIKDGGTFCAYGKRVPIFIQGGNLPPVFGEGIDIRYPVGAYIGNWNNIYYADGAMVRNDWVVIGPEGSFKNYGFSINGKEMTSLDKYNIPGLVSGDAYITDNPTDPDYPVLVLDNATFEWDYNASSSCLYHNLPEHGLTIKVIGDCKIDVPNKSCIFMDYARTTIEGGGTLRIHSKYPAFSSWVGSTLTIQGNTTVIAESENSNGYYSEEWDTFEIKDGAVFCARGMQEPIAYDNVPILGEGIGIRYPVGAYLGDWCVLNADGTKVMNDWIVIGPNTQTTQNLIDGVENVNVDLNLNNSWFDLQGRKISKPTKGIYIKNGKKILVK